jgi:uncharacterized protein (UPF0332 family)
VKCARVGDGVLGSVAFSEGIVHDLGEAESDYRVDEMADFWEKAEEALKVAEWAYQNGYYNEAVSRSYFAALKAALALLASLSLKPKNTVRIGYWVQANFANECIHRRKLMPRESAKVLSDLRDLRSRAEYTEEMMNEWLARQSLKLAREFLAAVERRLKP